MNDEIKPEYLPLIESRANPSVKPTYKIIARSMTLVGDSVVMLHKAGEDFVTNYYIRDLVTKDDIMDLMEKKEADLLRWVVNSEVTDPLKEGIK